MTFTERARQLKKDIPAIWLVMKNKETPLLAKIMAALTVAYALSPIDLIPDFIPVLGLLDDVILLPLMIVVIYRLVPKEILAACRLEAENIWKDGKPKKWTYAIPIVIIWVLLVVWVVGFFY